MCSRSVNVSGPIFQSVDPAVPTLDASTCRGHDVNPQMYLSQLLINLPAAQLSELSA
jgi:hypothetical protein